MTHADLLEATGLEEEVLGNLLTELATLEPELQQDEHLCWRLRAPEPTWTAAERLTLHRGLSALATCGAEPTAALRALANRLTAPLPTHVQVALPPLPQPAQQTLAPEQVLPLVTQAWLGGHALQFEYLRPGRAQSRRRVTLQPHLICAHPVTLELLVVGRELNGRRPQRTFRLARMLGAQLHPGRPAAAPVPVPICPAASAVTLRFTGQARLRVIEGRVPHLSEPIINPDGSVDATLQAPHDGRAALPWILSWGGGAEVLSPAPLRALWQAELRTALTAAQRPPTQFGAGAA
ncbi:helix-turn-helix transcriptional regulator [Deinococcus arboris]|nr:WYL domain-containing protein [Deinococcus arboris]